MIPFIFWRRLGDSLRPSYRSNLGESRQSPGAYLTELLAWLGWSGYTSGFGWGLIGAAFAFLPFAFYILALGYVYVAFTILLFNVCTHFGCIR